MEYKRDLSCVAYRRFGTPRKTFQHSTRGSMRKVERMRWRAVDSKRSGYVAHRTEKNVIACHVDHRVVHWSIRTITRGIPDVLHWLQKYTRGSVPPTHTRTCVTASPRRPPRWDHECLLQSIRVWRNIMKTSKQTLQTQGVYTPPKFYPSWGHRGAYCKTHGLRWLNQWTCWKGRIRTVVYADAAADTRCAAWTPG